MKTKEDNYIHSINLNAETDFPYLVLEVINDCIYPRNPGFQVMHWHEDLQFIYVIDGTVEVRTLETIIQLKTGEGAFINKNVVHLLTHSGNCHYNSFVFPDHFLKFYPGSLASNLVNQIVGKQQFQLYHFSKGVNWCENVLSLLEKMSLLEKNKTKSYVYEVLVLLSTLWLEIQKNITLPVVEKESVVNIRMQIFLEYIQNHYFEDISLAELSKSANVSKSECLRCFKLSMQTTPYKYLMEFRLSQAAILLQESNETIGNIATSVGFHQMSHFGKCFKEKTGYSPRKYRERNARI